MVDRLGSFLVAGTFLSKSEQSFIEGFAGTEMRQQDGGLVAHEVGAMRNDDAAQCCCERVGDGDRRYLKFESIMRQFF